MKYSQVKQLDESSFRRLTGVKRAVFEKMVEILDEAQLILRQRGGRVKKLGTAEQLLMTLQYLRQYNTYFEIAQTYGLSESNTYKTIRWVEDTLIKHPLFALPSKRALVRSDTKYEVILIDATETTIERPKKTAALLFGQEKETHTKKPSRR